jgi:hypothetical protein
MLLFICRTAQRIRMNSMLRSRWDFFIAAMMVTSFVTFQNLYAQVDQGTGTTRGATTNYHFAEPNELTITVSVLGAIRNPGRYEISRTIDLLNFLAIAGGTLDNADLGNVQIYRTLEVGGRLERREIRIDLEDLVRFQAEPFELQQGDMLHIGRKTGLTLPEFVSLISTAATATLAIIAIVQITGPGQHR